MEFVTLKNKKSTLTLTQSGMLAALLEHQQCKVIENAQRRARREQLRAAFWSILTRLWTRADGCLRKANVG